jgi:hypothetical protein
MRCDRTVALAGLRGIRAGLNAGTCVMDCLGLTGGCVGVKKSVCTMCTPLPSDWAVPVPDGLVPGMFPGVPSVCRGRKPVQVPPRARCFRRSGAYLVPD